MSKSDDPAFFAPGAKIIAKFMGAFLEAEVKNVEKKLMVKVVLKESANKTLVVQHEELHDAALKVGEITRIMYEGKPVPCEIAHITDKSRYRIVFNDGDEKWMQRRHLLPSPDYTQPPPETAPASAPRDPEMSDEPAYIRVGTSVTTVEGALECVVIQIEKRIEVEVVTLENPTQIITKTIGHEDIPNAELRVGVIGDAMIDGECVTCEISHVKDKSKYLIRYHDDEEEWVNRNQLTNPSEEDMQMTTDDEDDDEEDGDEAEDEEDGESN